MASLGTVFLSMSWVLLDMFSSPHRIFVFTSVLLDQTIGGGIPVGHDNNRTIPILRRVMLNASTREI
ncbi:hypothetical protein WD019_09380 [Fictibacillus sp. Mic-4]|uniref:hypothetical protein n=1 Tax=Fictibacillus sp. Mic-4 TaxID=3132826 RepID=UPI003CEC7320